MVLYPALPDPDAQRAFDEAAGRVASFVVGAGGLVAGFIMGVFFGRWEGTALELSAIGTLATSVVAWRYCPESVRWLVANLVFLLVEVVCVGLAVS